MPGLWKQESFSQVLCVPGTDSEIRIVKGGEGGKVAQHGIF
jgi:hypothetical protein